MGSYRSKPITEKVSEGGEFLKNDRKVIYGASAMQGWRVAMEDAYSIVPNFDDNSSLFGVYDGHGGREVAMYCANHMPDMIRGCYHGDIGNALKDAFMKCDRMVIEREAVHEMKTYDEDEIPEDENDVESKEELDNLLEESAMPLQTLLSRYNAPMLENSREEEKEGMKRQGINSILKLLINSEVDLDTSSEDGEEEEEEEIDEEDGQEDEQDGEEDLREGEDLKEEDNLKDANSKKDPDAVESVAEGADSANEENGADRQVSSTTQEDKHVSPGGFCEPPASHNSIRTTESNSLTCKSSSEVNKDDLPDSSNSMASDATTSFKSIPERALKREDSTNKFKLLDLLTAGPKEAGPTRRSRKRVYPDDDPEDIEESSPKKSNPRSLAKQGYHSGTTAVVGLLREKDFIVANAGDSKCVLSSRGKAVDMSVDHKPTDEVELLRIENAGGQVGPDERVNGGLNLSRAIGDHFYKENFTLPLEDQMISAMPDIKSVPLTNDEDFIVFACDGIWNSLTSQEVVDFVNNRLKLLKDGQKKPTSDDLIKICESLCDTCLAENTDNDGVGCDNMTCIIIYLAR